MKILSAFIAIAMLSAAGFSALYDRVLYGPSQPSPERFVNNPNQPEPTDANWTSRWNIGAKV